MAVIRLKDDKTDLNGITPEMVAGLIIAASVYNDHGYDCVITSGNDRDHSNTSLHYSGNALDYRTSNLPDAETAQIITAEIKANCGINYDVIYEGDHIHHEYQRRRPRHVRQQKHKHV